MDADRFVVNVDGAVVRDGEYLLVERSPEEEHAAGSLAFPGGTVEHPDDEDATIESTAARELAEEVGIRVGDVEYVCSRTFEADDGTRCLNVVTLCEYVRGTARVRAADEITAVHWLSADDVADRDDVPDFLERDVKRLEERRAATRG